MNVLFDISHAFDINLFKLFVKELKSVYDINCYFYVKNKPHVFEICGNLELNFIYENKFSNYKERFLFAPIRIAKLVKLVKKLNIRLIIGNSLVDGSIAAYIKNIPSISLMGNDHASFQNILSSFFSKTIISPSKSKLNYGDKQIKFPFIAEFSYLSPKFFLPNKNRLPDYLFDNGPPLIYRTLSWDATHDLRYKQQEKEYDIIRQLAKDNPLFISNEGQIPSDLHSLILPFRDNRIHDLLAFSKGYIGAGLTTAVESVALGTPAIYTNMLTNGYLEYLISNEVIYHVPNLNKFPIEFLHFLENENYKKKVQAIYNQNYNLISIMTKLIQKYKN